MNDAEQLIFILVMFFIVLPLMVVVGVKSEIFTRDMNQRLGESDRDHLDRIRFRRK